MRVEADSCATGAVDCVDWEGEAAVGDRSEGSIVGKIDVCRL